MKKRRLFSRGSITVFVTAILIPTIFLAGFLTDIARIKFYSNQALMAADDYGEAVITQYDDLLKELYGLFAVTQDEEGLKGIETLQNYMQTSFDPNSNTISFSHLQGTILNQGTSYSGFMPYASAELELEYEAASDEANLGNNDVLATQIGDFMRYRVVEQLMDSDEDSWLLEALEAAEESEANNDAVEAKNDFDEQCENALNAMKDYYTQLCKMDTYVENYLKSLNKNYQNAKAGIEETDGIEKSERYKDYIEAAEKQANMDELDKTVQEEEGDSEDEIDLEEEGKYFEEKYKKLIKAYENCYNDGEAQTGYPVTFDNYDSEANKLLEYAKKAKKELEKVRTAREELQEKLEADGVSEDLKDNVENENAEVYKLFDTDDPSVDGSNYIAIADFFVSQSSLNETFAEAAENISDYLEERMEYDLRYYYGIEDTASEPQGRAREIEISKFDRYDDEQQCKELQELLEKTFGGSEESDAEKEAKDKQDEAEDKTDDVQKKLKEEDAATTARNIPDTVEIGDDGKAGSFKFSKLVESASTLFEGGLKEAGNELLLKIYTACYDKGMFSDRVTNISTDQNAETETSLTGYELCDKVNYLYQAELEYLYGGHKSSSENLKEARNAILLYRGAVNLAATYTISAVNSAIEEITGACMVVNPFLGIAVAAALRLGVASMETYADWEELKEGKSVTLLKTELSDLTTVQNGTLDELLSKLSDKASAASSATTKIKLNYEQYLQILLVVFTPREDLISRTGDLIALNINNVKQGSDFTSLQFQMDSAITAVKASCSIHLDYIAMPDGFAQKTLDSDTYTEIQEFEKNKYKFSVIRGY